MKRNLLTTEAFADWCEKHPADEAYVYGDNTGCAYCLYLQSIGVDRPNVGGTSWNSATDDRERDLPDDIVEALVNEPWTFGALSNRLRAS